MREGYVLNNQDKGEHDKDGTRITEHSALRDAQTSHATYRVCGHAGLPNRGWHVLRHSFGTHAARFGVNPWQLMEWMGHKRIDETMGYVHIAERLSIDSCRAGRSRHERNRSNGSRSQDA